MNQGLYQKFLHIGFAIMLWYWAQGTHHALYHLLPWYEILEILDIKWKHQNWQCPTNNQIIWNCLLLAKIEIYLSDKLQDFPNKTLKVKYCCVSGGLIKSFYNSIDFKLQLREPFKNQKLLSGFCPLRGGGVPPLSANLFWAQWLSVKGGVPPKFR